MGSCLCCARRQAATGPVPEEDLSPVVGLINPKGPVGVHRRQGRGLSRHTPPEDLVQFE